MNPPTHRRTSRALLSTGLFMIWLTTTPDLRAGCCCRNWMTQVRYQTNSALPVEGELDLGCVRRRMNADSILADIACILRENPSMTMVLMGHADSEEIDADALSVQRAQRLACELVSTYGIEAGRLTTEGKGAGQPRITGHQLNRMPRKERSQGRLYNRRVEFHVIKYDWAPPHVDGIAAAHFLADPAPPTTSAPSFCAAHTATDAPDEAPDTEALVEGPDNTLIVVDRAVGLSPESPSIQLEALVPMITPNPIMNDELNIVWLPGSAQELSIRLMTSDGRFIGEHRPITVAQGARLQLPVPTALPGGTYILRISTRAQDWSLRFMKP